MKLKIQTFTASKGDHKHKNMCLYIIPTQSGLKLCFIFNILNKIKIPIRKKVPSTLIYYCTTYDKIWKKKHQHDQ